MTRKATDPTTRAYAQRRTTQGLPKPEIIRCLKRYAAREIYTAPTRPETQPTSTNDLPKTA